MTNKILSILTLIHRWGGLIGGWFCFFLVITGTVSVFDLEIARWMQPELTKYQYTETVSEASMQRCYDVWLENNRKNQFSFVILPSERYPFLQVLYSQGALLKWQNIDPKTGKVIYAQQTVGGYFFDSLHNNLLMGHSIGDVVIIILSILFFIFILSGFVIHLKHLWKEFFKVRPKASALRFVLDIHLGIGVFFLPFLLIMVISGFLFYAPNYISFLNAPPSQYNSTPYKALQLDSNNSAKNLYSLVQEAKTTFQSMPGFILITPKQIHVVQSDTNQLAIMRNFIELDRVSNHVSLKINQSTTGRYFQNLMFGFHLARSGGSVLRWVYFVTGIGASVLVATGLLFFSNKRRHFNKKHVSATLLVFYKIVDGIHVGVIMGTLLALTAVLWANMLFSFAGVQKPFLEVVTFLAIFVLSFTEGLFYTFYSNVMKAWQHQIGLFAGLCIFLPIIKFILYPSMFHALLGFNCLYLLMSIVFIMIGVSFLLLYLHLKRKKVFS